MVKASPPATMAPADIAVCVTLISCRFVLPHSLSRNMDISTTNIIGHGTELSFRATNMELMVRITLPTDPMIRPLIVSCLFDIIFFLL